VRVFVVVLVALVVVLAVLCEVCLLQAATLRRKVRAVLPPEDTEEKDR
jgi:archaellin